MALSTKTRAVFGIVSFLLQRSMTARLGESGRVALLRLVPQRLLPLAGQGGLRMRGRHDIGDGLISGGVVLLLELATRASAASLLHEHVDRLSWQR